MNPTMSNNLNSVFNETSPEVSNPNNIIDSVTHAITKIPNNIAQIPAKVMICFYIRYPTVNKEEWDVWVSTQFQVVHTFNDLNPEWAETMLKRFNNASEEAKLRGSGWSEGRLLEIKLKQAKYSPIVGKLYVPLPRALVLKRAVLNMKNDDNKCFMWCVLAKLFPVKEHGERASYYTKHVKHLKFDGIHFPVSIDQIDQFENQNKLTIKPYGWTEERQLFPIRISKKAPSICDSLDSHIDLLLIDNHYTLIRSISRLIA